MRLYWPKTTPPSILPAGEGTWNPPAVLQVQQAKPRPCHCCPRSEAATGAALDFAERAKQGGERLSPLGTNSSKRVVSHGFPAFHARHNRPRIRSGPLPKKVVARPVWVQ